MLVNKMVAEIDGNELACQIAEACIGVQRPEGQTAAEALLAFDAEARQGFILAAQRATIYISTCLANAKKVS